MVKKVLVIGAGMSGLSAAYHLQQHGYEVSVLESADRPGGRVTTLRSQGYIIDAGPDAATIDYRDWLELVDEMGLREQLVHSSNVLGIARGHRIIDIDPAKPLDCVLTPALSLSAKLRLLMALPGLPKRLKGLDSFELVQSADRDDPQVNALTHANALFGHEVAAYLIDPAVRLTTGSGAQHASMLAALAPLSAWTKPLINLRGGLETLPRALAERVPVRYRVAASRVEENGQGVTVHYRDESGAERVENADHCVIAAMYHTARQLWSPLASKAPELDRKLKDVKLISVSLGYQALCRSKAYAISVPTSEYPDLLLGFLQHNKAPDRAPAGHSLITLYTDTTAFERYNAKTDDEIVAWASAIIEQWFPELRGKRELASVSRWPKAGYLADPGFWKRTATLVESMSSSTRVHLAGDLFGAGSMESAARWGKRAAQAIMTIEGRSQ